MIWLLPIIWTIAAWLGVCYRKTTGPNTFGVQTMIKAISGTILTLCIWLGFFIAMWAVK